MVKIQVGGLFYSCSSHNFIDSRLNVLEHMISWGMCFRCLDLAHELTSALLVFLATEDEPRERLFLFPTQISMLVLESVEYEYERCMFLW